MQTAPDRSGARVVLECIVKFDAMIEIKLIGSLMLCISGVIMAVSYSRYQQKKLSSIDGLISLILYMKGQIDCFSRPRSEILSSLPPEVFCACNCPRGASTLEEIVEACRIYLDDESLRLAASFASEFGGSFRDEQIRRCDYYITALSEERKRVFSSVKARSRSGGALFVCACIGIMILLW